MPDHKCHATGCNVSVHPKYLMCGRHWAMVPKPLQVAVWHNYRVGQEVDKQPSEKYIVAMQDAIHAVEELEKLRAKVGDANPGGHLQPGGPLSQPQVGGGAGDANPGGSVSPGAVTGRRGRSGKTGSDDATE